MSPHSYRDLFSHLISRDRLAPNLNICHILDIANPLVGRFFVICAIFAIFAKFCHVRQSRQFRRNRHSPREHFCPPNLIARPLAKICHFRENRQNCHFPRVHIWHPIGLLHDDVIFLQGPESFSGLLSCAN